MTGTGTDPVFALLDPAFSGAPLDPALPEGAEELADLLHQVGLPQPAESLAQVSQAFRNAQSQIDGILTEPFLAFLRTVRDYLSGEAGLDDIEAAHASWKGTESK